MPDFVDVSKIVLTDAELAVFDRLSQTEPLEIPRSVYISLYRKKLVHGGSLGWFSDTPPETVSCRLTPLGSDLAAFRVLASKQLAADQEKEATRLKERHEDIARDERHHKEQKMVTLKAAVFACVLTGVVSVASGVVLAYVLHLFGL